MSRVASCAGAPSTGAGRPTDPPATFVAGGVLAPIETKGMTGSDVVKLMATTRERIAAAEAELRAERAALGWENRAPSAPAD
jgi:hypothetical protein